MENDQLGQVEETDYSLIVFRYLYKIYTNFTHEIFWVFEFSLGNFQGLFILCEILYLTKFVYL